MSTLYEIFKVSEDASQDEIKTAYEKIIKKSESMPQTEEIIQKMQRVKIAYGILSDLEKRKKYDDDLANKRAEELVKNVEQKQEIDKTENHQNKEVSQNEDEKIEEKINSEAQRIRIEQEIDRQINHAIEKQKIDEKNRKLYEKQIKKRMREEKRQTKKKMQLEKEMQIQAYGRYLEKQGYKVKYPWTWPRVKRLLTSIISVIMVAVVLWQIPYVRENLIKLYEENFIIKMLIDMILSIFNAIAGLFKH